jgi:hypothetical protein
MNKWYGVAVRAPWLLLVILSLIGAAQGVSVVAKQNGLLRRDLASTIDPAAATVTADFIRPGLAFNIVSVTITGQTVAVHFTMKDSSGVALDRLGVDTAGTVSTSFVIHSQGTRNPNHSVVQQLLPEQRHRHYGRGHGDAGHRR